MRRWVLAALVVAVVGFGVATVAFGAGDWGPDHHEVVTRSIAPDGTETIVVREGPRGFFPFGLLLFPLVILFWIAVFRAFVFRGPWGSRGPWTWGGPPANEPPGWFDEWHRRAHGDAAEQQPPAANPS